MEKLSLAELTAAAAASDGPGFPPPNDVKFGGVDPLGLRQLNFNLMDEVLPGLNNVARHIRPFVIVAWAWRRAIQLAQARGLEKIPPDHLPNFVDRIEVIYAWSELLKNTKVDLPGRQALWRVFKDKQHYKFDGAGWKKLRDERRYSTALSAPINYGPGLKMLGWVERHPKYPGVLIPTEIAGPALEAFEARMAKHLHHPVFKEFGAVRREKHQADGHCCCRCHLLNLSCLLCHVGSFVDLLQRRVDRREIKKPLRAALPLGYTATQECRDGEKSRTQSIPQVTRTNHASLCASGPDE